MTTRQHWEPPAAVHLDTGGVPVLVVPLPEQHTVAVEVVIAGGARLDPAGAEGAAGVYAALLREGSAAHPGGSWSAALQRCGAAAYGGATYASTRLSLDTLPAGLDRALALLGEALSAPALDPGDALRLRDAAVGQARVAEATAAQRAQRELRRVTRAGGHRASVPVSGTVDSLLTVTPDLLAGLHRQVGAARAVVVAAGPVTAAEVAALAERHLPRPAAESAPPPPPDPVEPGVAPVVVHVATAGTQCQLLLGRVVGDRRAADTAALRVAAHALAGSLHARVDAVLRETLGLTYGMRARLHDRVGDGLLAIGGGVEASGAERARAALLDVLDEAVRRPPDRAEVDAARSFMLGAAAVGRHTARPWVEALADEVEATAEPAAAADALAVRLRALSAVSQDDVAAAVSRHLQPESLAAVTVGPAQAPEGSSPPVFS